jgi:hypothetical protein
MDKQDQQAIMNRLNYQPPMRATNLNSSLSPYDRIQ